MSAESMQYEKEMGPHRFDSEEETWMVEDKDWGGRNRAGRPGRAKSRRKSRKRRDREWKDEIQDGRRDAADSADLVDESHLSDEERAYRSAEKLAEKKVALSHLAIRAAVITVPLLIFMPIVGVVSLIYFGVQIGRRATRVLYEPRLREKFLHGEVSRRVQTRVSSERRHLEGEHHRSLEQLSASIAHEIRNPITAAKSLVQQMGEDPNGADQAEYARVAVAELERVEKSISHLLRFAREEETQVGPVLMEDVLESAIETFKDRAGRGDIKIVRQYDSDGSLEGDAEQLRRVTINIVGNAIDALEEAGIDQPEIRVSLGENLAGTEVWVRIADNGLGINEDVRDQIFDPFYTSREEGTGLGLALCRKIVDNHGGSIEVESAAGDGTEFIMTFPKTSGRKAGQP
jgi:two-component system sensor histidine kinase HydH